MGPSITGRVDFTTGALILTCQHCGVISTDHPITVPDYQTRTRAFAMVHEDCGDWQSPAGVTVSRSAQGWFIAEVMCGSLSARAATRRRAVDLVLSLRDRRPPHG